MKTKIFTDIEAFLKRQDKNINGVTQEFADQSPGWDKESNNSGCWKCSDCSRCSRCSRCSGCSKIAFSNDLKNARPVQGGESEEKLSDFIMKVPVIPGIHGKVLEAVKAPNALDMGTWHRCETTHCRAGWVVTLAGQAGRKLEELTSPQFAATQIYHASCPDVPVSPVRFFHGNQKAMEDIVRCAELEKNLSVKGV